MLKEQDVTSGKLASKSKNMSKQGGGKKHRMQQIACLGQGSVIGCEDILVAKSDTHVTSLVCLSMTGELYKLDKDFFFSKVHGMSTFLRKLEK